MQYTARQKAGEEEREGVRGKKRETANTSWELGMEGDVTTS